MSPRVTLVGARALASTSDLDVARAILRRYDARTPEQDATRARMLAFVDAHPADAHSRSCVPGHLTASALVVDARRERALLTFHKKLRRWLQLGGHCDGDANLAAVALREAIEESGIDELVIDPAPIDLDIHVIPARHDEPEHLHLDTRFLVVAPDGATLRVSEESLALAWFTRGELAAIDTDNSVRRLIKLAFG